jgi:hypothetical protein
MRPGQARAREREAERLRPAAGRRVDDERDRVAPVLRPPLARDDFLFVAVRPLRLLVLLFEPVGIWIGG